MSVFNTSRLLGKTILITGASGGIGAVSRHKTVLRCDSLLINYFRVGVGDCLAFRKGRLKSRLTSEASG